MELPEPSEEETGRFSALTMPLVTVLSRPNGEPIATTSWPTLRSLELPSVAAVRPDWPSALITARSVTGSRPTMSALAVLPSLNDTVTEPPSAAASTTWLLVRMSPSLEMMMPVPLPPDSSPELSPRTLICTVEGRTLDATASTSPEAT